jgi:hypothetical protein
MDTSLPFCKYPTSADTEQHGVLPLPDELPKANFPAGEIQPLTVAGTLTTEQFEEMVKIVATSFVEREPMLRHLNEPVKYSKVELFSAFLNHVVLPKPDALQQSLVLLQEGHVVGVAVNETFHFTEEDTAKDGSNNSSSDTKDGPVPELLQETERFFAPVMELLSTQDKEAIQLLSQHSNEFSSAYKEHRVGHIFMIARSNNITANDMFHLMVGSVLLYKQLGFSFVIVEATNNWTGAVCEKLGAVRAHFSPFRVKQHPGISSDGYLSSKDSGSMLYVLRI